MLEEDNRDYFGNWRDKYMNEDFRYGFRIGQYEVLISIFRGKEGYIHEEDKIRILTEETYNELRKFHERYSNLPLQKMAERLLGESEYLFGHL